MVFTRRQALEQKKPKTKKKGDAQDDRTARRQVIILPAGPRIARCC